MVGVETKKRQKRHTQKTQVSIKLMASLAPARAEVESGVVAKADQYYILSVFAEDGSCCSKSTSCKEKEGNYDIDMPYL